MSDFSIINDTLEYLNNDLFTLDKLEYGDDYSGTDSVWLLFIINAEDNKKDYPNLVKKINEFCDLLTNKLFNNGLSAWPYLQFTIKKGE